MLFDAFADARFTETVAFLRTAWQEAGDFGSVLAKDAPEDGKGSHSIDVVIAVEDDFFLAAKGEVDAFDGTRHVRQRVGIAQIAKPRIQKSLGLGRIIEAFDGEQFCQKIGNAQLAAKDLTDVIVPARGRNP